MLNVHTYRFSADGLMTDNQTNLAIKGIIAIKAMSKMSLIVNQAHDVDKYSVRAGLLNDAQRNLLAFRVQLRIFMPNGRALH